MLKNEIKKNIKNNQSESVKPITWVMRRRQYNRNKIKKQHDLTCQIHNSGYEIEPS
jgi:hypothetical protein